MIESTAQVSYRLLNNGVHEIVPHEASRRSVQQIFAILDRIYEATPEGQLVRYIIADHRGVGMLPLNHVANYGRAWLVKNPNHHPTRSLYLNNTNALLSSGMTILNVIQRASKSSWKWRFFEVANAEAGMKWLLSND